jgi:DNA-binding MurR/RpiR family transcriptional regulator
MARRTEMAEEGDLIRTRTRRAQGATLAELARSYDVSRSTISRLTA